MSNNKANQVTNFITPVSDTDNYPTHKAIYGLGGFKSVGSISERDNIPSGRLELGMWVNVTGDGIYELGPTGWIPATGTSGAGENFANTDLSFGGINRTHLLQGSDFRILTDDNEVGLQVSDDFLQFGGLVDSKGGIQVEESIVGIRGAFVEIQSTVIGTPVQFFLYDGNNKAVVLSAPSGLANSFNLVLPTGIGSSGNFLSTDESGNLDWSSISIPDPPDNMVSLYDEGILLTGDMSGLNFIGPTVNVTHSGDGLYDVTITSTGSEASISSDSENIVATGTDGGIYSSGFRFLDEFPGGYNTEIVRMVEGVPQLKEHSVIYVDDFTGNNLTQKFEAAMERYSFGNTIRGATTVVLPHGWQYITRPLRFIAPGIPRGEAQILNDWSFVGGHTTVVWWEDNTSGYQNLPMIELPIGNRMTISNMVLIGSKVGDFSDSGIVSGSVGIWVRQPFDYNVNSSYGTQFNQIGIENQQYGVWVGEQAGPDMTSHSFNNVQLRNCLTGAVCEGANVDSITFDTCRLNGTRMHCGWHVKYGTNNLFASGEYKDPWDNPVPITWTDNVHFPSGAPAWNARLVDISGNNRNHPDFDDLTGKNRGGTSKVNVSNTNISFNPFVDPGDTGLPTTYAFNLEASSINAQGLRIEGPHSAFMKVTQIPGNSNFMDSRFFTVLERVNNADSVREPFDIFFSSHNAGNPTIIRDCHFHTGTIPEEVYNTNQIFIYDGLITLGTEPIILHPTGEPRFDTSITHDFGIQQHIWTPATSEAVLDLNDTSPSQTTTLTSDQLLTFSGTPPTDRDRTYYLEVEHTGNILTISGVNDPAGSFVPPTYSPYIVAFKTTSSGIPRFAGVI